MKSDRLDLAIDMIICMAIQDYARSENISEEESRNLLMGSKAVEVLYDSDNRFWTEGPDAFISLYRETG